MPAGDAQRVWFPEMLRELTTHWSSTMSWEELRSLCSKMMEKRRAIRNERGIASPKMRCPRCGVITTAEISGISIRSALFALKSAGTISETQFASLDKSWRKHRSRHQLNAYGNPLTEAGRNCCSTADEDATEL